MCSSIRCHVTTSNIVTYDTRDRQTPNDDTCDRNTRVLKAKSLSFTNFTVSKKLTSVKTKKLRHVTCDNSSVKYASHVTILVHLDIL